MDEQASRNDGLRNIRTHYETLLTPAESSLTPPPAIHKTYKRRYVGLVELILLNMMVSWSGSNFIH